jgi:hypothetical protein
VGPAQIGRREGGGLRKTSTYWYSVVHAIVECEDCEWRTESYKNGQALAKIHAKKHGHRVHGELGIGFGYDYRDKKEA